MKTNTAQHTPTPWHVHEKYNDQIMGIEDDYIIATVSADSRNFTEQRPSIANTEIIVRAVNSHEALLKIARAYIKIAAIYGVNHEKASAVIAQAEKP